MQQPAVPELAHTHTRPIHWVATATAIAGVIAATSFFGPDDATAQPHHPTATAPRHTAPPKPAPAPDPDRATYPIECHGSKVLVEKSATGDLDGDGRPETVVAVRCDAGIGTPPNGVYVLTPSTTPTDGAPRVVATLVDPDARLTVTGVRISHRVVTTDVLGYSTADVPSCCPDVRRSTSWQWRGGSFQQVTPGSARGA